MSGQGRRRHQGLLTILSVGLLAFCIGNCACWPGNGTGKATGNHERYLEEGAMTFDDKRFAEVELNSLGPSACSPEVPADRSFRGIIIVAPKLIFFSPRQLSALTIPVCGFLRQEALRMPDGGAETMRIVVVNQETGDEYSGYPVFSDMPEPPPPDENPIRPEELEGIVVGVYFNFDLMEVVRLSREDGTYDVWLELGEEGLENHLRSNRIAFRLIPKDAD